MLQWLGGFLCQRCYGEKVLAMDNFSVKPQHYEKQSLAMCIDIFCFVKSPDLFYRGLHTTTQVPILSIAVSSL